MPRIRAGPVVVMLAAPLALGQEAINTNAATQPAKGRFVLREQLRLTWFGDDPTDGERSADSQQLVTSVSLGLTGELSATLEMPLERQSIDMGAGSQVSTGAGDLIATLKYRIWTYNPGPLDTTRLSLLAGASLPAGSDPFSSDSVDPIVGGVFTMVRGRSGFNQALEYRFNSGDGDEDPLIGGAGPDDALRYDSAYLFRLAPERYGEGGNAATYAVLELNGLYETNGDNQIFLSPGVLYEATTWALEASVQLPIYQDLADRPETDVVVVVGVRLLF